jgi:hypothetical protein
MNSLYSVVSYELVMHTATFLEVPKLLFYPSWISWLYPPHGGHQAGITVFQGSSGRTDK